MTPNPHQHDHNIDTALNTLRAAQPASGNADEAFAAMNARLLRNVRTAADQHTTSRVQWLTLPRLAFATAALAGVWLGAHLLSTSSTHPQQLADATSGAPPVTVLSSRVGSAGRQPAQHAPVRLSTVAVPTVTLAVGHPTASPAQTAAIDPAFLPSQPAPEEPLTRQERLLKSLANRRKPIMLALLEPNEPDLSTLRQPNGPSPLLAGFQPDPQPASQAGNTTSPPDDIPQP
jgi:hypothetical protein